MGIMMPSESLHWVNSYMQKNFWSEPNLRQTTANGHHPTLLWCFLTSVHQEELDTDRQQVKEKPTGSVPLRGAAVGRYCRNLLLSVSIKLLRLVITAATVILLDIRFMLHYSISQRNITFALFNQRWHWLALCH